MIIKIERFRAVFGWFAVGLTTLAGCFWSFWGIIENFHEGWYHPTLIANLAMMFGQYLLPMMMFVVAGGISVYWPRVGGTIHFIAAAWAAWHFRGATFIVLYVLIVGPLVLMAIGYWWGRPQPRRWAVTTILCMPLITLVLCGAEPVYRVSTRWDDGDLGLRVIDGNGVSLAWAPVGPGWPDHGVSWLEASQKCLYLKEDGRELADSPQGIWRLPTVDEVVRSSCRHGRNAEGQWNHETEKAIFSIVPDKEPPLWNNHSKIIYWWTATEADSTRAFRFCYNGHVMALSKKVAYGYLGFRAVKDPKKIKD